VNSQPGAIFFNAKDGPLSSLGVRETQRTQKRGRCVFGKKERDRRGRFVFGRKSMRMKNKYLIIIDMQNDFVTGTLGSPYAEAIAGGACEKIRTFDGIVVFTQDTHDENYRETQEGRILPVPHCIKGTEGWALAPGIEGLRAELGARVFEKPCFGSVGLAEYLREENEKLRIDSIELAGLCTDICVVANSLRLKTDLPETAILVDAACCAGTTPENHKAALMVLKSCQIRVM
jgi:nicotinamidase-related amidase